MVGVVEDCDVKKTEKCLFSFRVDSKSKYLTDYAKSGERRWSSI